MGLEPTLSEAAVAMWKLPIDFQFNLTQLTQMYRARFVDLDLLDIKSGKYNIPQLEKKLGLLIQNSSISWANPWLATGEGIAIFANRLLRMTHHSSPRESRHPMNHLCLILLLFDSWNTFWKIYKHSESNVLEANKAAETNLIDSSSPRMNTDNAVRTACLQAIQAGQSISSIAKMNGIAVATVMTWAAKEGIASPRRPKRLHLEIRKRLVRMLSHGADKIQVATEFGVSIQTITRVLMTEPGLSDLWSDVRFARAQKQACKTWLNAMNSFPRASSVQWRSLEPAAYAWLYRNDRSWLQEAIRSRPIPAQTSNWRRDWEERDEQFSQAVRLAGLNFSGTHPHKRLTLGELFSIVKGLREKQSVLHKMPRTQTAIQNACSATRAADRSSQYSWTETGLIR
jgi:transposase